jgi:hypothetical protein
VSRPGGCTNIRPAASVFGLAGDQSRARGGKTRPCSWTALGVERQGAATRPTTRVCPVVEGGWFGFRRPFTLWA